MHICVYVCVCVCTCAVTFKSLKRDTGGSKLGVGEALGFESSRRWCLQKKKNHSCARGLQNRGQILKTSVSTPLGNQ